MGWKADRLTVKLGPALVATLAVTLALCTVVSAQPQAAPNAPQIPTLPHVFYGKVRTDKGKLLVAGSEVTGRSAHGASGGWTGTVTGLVEVVDDPIPSSRYGYDGWFLVPGLDPDERGSGAVSGEPIEFYVQGVRATACDAIQGTCGPTYPMAYAAFTELDLVVDLSYTITATAGPNGSISPSGAVMVDYGFDQEFTFTPADNYLILDVLVDGVSNPSAVAASKYTFESVKENHTIHVTFVRANYYFTVNAGVGCTITPPGPTVTAPYKGSITFNIAANTGYDLVDVLKDGVSQGPIPSVTFSNVDADHTIAATCVRKQFTITPTWASGGSINPGTVQTVFYGDSLTFNIVPDTGYLVDNVLVDGVSQGAITSHTFSNVTANHTITASFRWISVTVTPTPTPTSTRQTQTPTATATSTATGTPTGTPPSTPWYDARLVYLPLLLHAMPAPSLDSITPPEDTPSYAVRWSAVAGAFSYILERATSLSFGDAVQVYNATATEYTAASAGITTYYYRVKARGTVGDSTWSNAQAVSLRWELEPNGEAIDAVRTGPLQSGLEYYGTLTGTDDRGNDYFFFDLSSDRPVELWLTHMAADQDFNLVLRNASLAMVPNGFSGQTGNADEHIATAVLPAGRYYVQVNRVGGISSQPYHLRGTW